MHVDSAISSAAPARLLSSVSISEGSIDTCSWKMRKKQRDRATSEANCRSVQGDGLTRSVAARSNGIAFSYSSIDSRL